MGQARRVLADVYLGNSRIVQYRVRDPYGISAEVVEPHAVAPDGHQEPVPGIGDGFLVGVSLLPYRNIGEVIEAFVSLGSPARDRGSEALRGSPKGWRAGQRNVRRQEERRGAALAVRPRARPDRRVVRGLLAHAVGG